MTARVKVYQVTAFLVGCPAAKAVYQDIHPAERRSVESISNPARKNNLLGI